jgi:hypothetical protein
MKKNYYLLALAGILSLNACKNTETAKDFSYVMTKGNSSEVAEFIKKTHSEDTRYPILKKRYAELRNKEWVRHDYTTNTIPCETITKTTIKPEEKSKNKETEEYNLLVKNFEENSKKKKVEMLNSLFDNDKSKQDIQLLVKNDSKCNIILRINGARNISIPIQAQRENSVLLPKGTYNIKSMICDTEYSSQKTFTKNAFLTLKLNTKINNKLN